MGNEITLEQLSAEAELLTKERALTLAANAGYVEPATRQLEQYVDRGVSPGLVMNMSDQVLKGFETAGIAGDRPHQIAAVAGVIAYTMNRRDDHGITDEYLAGFIEKRRTQVAQSVLIGSFIEHGLMSENLKEKFGVAYHKIDPGMFLENLDSNDESGADESVAVIDRTKENEVDSRTLEKAKTLEDLNIAFETHPNKDSEEIVAAYNQIVALKIRDKRVKFDESLAYYNSLKSYQNPENDKSEIEDVEFASLEELHVALDEKFLNLIDQHVYKISGDNQQIINLVQGYKLKTTKDHPDYPDFLQRYNSGVALAFRVFIDGIKANDIEKFDDKVAEQRMRLRENSQKQNFQDYSTVNLDLRKLSAEDTPDILKSIYANAIRLTDDDILAKQLFIEEVLDRLHANGNRYPQVYELSKLHGLVNDSELRSKIGLLHDRAFLAQAQILYRRGEYHGVVNLLTSTNFLLDDNHPIVELARSLFYDAYRLETRHVE